MINQITITQQPVMVFSSNTNGYGGGVAMVNVAPQYPQAQAVATYAQPPPEAMVVVSTGSSNSNGGYANVSQVDDKGKHFDLLMHI